MVLSRQLEQQTEERDTKRRDALYKTLEFDLAGVIAFGGGELTGFAMNYEEFSCLVVLKADFEGKNMVSFIYSDTMTNCLLRAVSLGKNNRLKWKLDVWRPSGA